MPGPLDIATGVLGKNENVDRAALQDYLRTGGVNLDPATRAWCAAFVNSTLAQAGMSGTGSNMARSFMNWGTPVDTPERGDIAVFRRGDPNGPLGHVGFFEGYNPDGTIKILAGNQGNAVAYGDMAAADLLGFRRAAPAGGGTQTVQAAPVPGVAQAPPPAPTTAQPFAAPAEPGQALGALFVQAAQGYRDRKREEEAADQARRTALFGGRSGLASLYG